MNGEDDETTERDDSPREEEGERNDARAMMDAMPLRASEATLRKMGGNRKMRGRGAKCICKTWRKK